MIDTSTLFNELATTLHGKPDEFYCRVSLDKYFEPGRDGLAWTWKAVVGHKYDDRFYCTLTGFGVTNASSLMNGDFSEPVKKHAYLLLNSYADFLATKYDRVIARMNRE